MFQISEFVQSIRGRIAPAPEIDRRVVMPTPETDAASERVYDAEERLAAARAARDKAAVAEAERELDEAREASSQAFEAAWEAQQGQPNAEFWDALAAARHRVTDAWDTIDELEEHRAYVNVHSPDLVENADNAIDAAYAELEAAQAEEERLEEEAAAAGLEEAGRVDPSGYLLAEDELADTQEDVRDAGEDEWDRLTAAQQRVNDAWAEVNRLKESGTNEEIRNAYDEVEVAETELAAARQEGEALSVYGEYVDPSEYFRAEDELADDGMELA